MIWVAWRQHRFECLILGGVLALLAIFLLITGLDMAQTFQQTGLGACLAQGNRSHCSNLVDIFQTQYGFIHTSASWISILVALLGTLVGAPLVARELEQGTHRLIWTQSITRFHWLTTKLAFVLIIGLVAAGILMALLIWWYGPYNAFNGHFLPLAFDFEGPMWLASILLALALGVFAGTLTRKTVLAMFLTLILFATIRLPVELFLRPNYEPGITVTWSANQTAPQNISSDDWIVASGFIDAQGNPNQQFHCTSAQTLNQCVQAAGLHYYRTYQPADRFWTFQWIETGIYLVFVILALGATFWLVGRQLN
jgi:ABC-type transport system involved in multi-copper enzyme maturation permease subunit